MSSFFNNLNTLILAKSSSLFKKKQSDKLSDIFLAKFQNLLDDYISNYLVKYLFLFLFAGFFIFEFAFYTLNMMELNTGTIPFVLNLEENLFYCINTQFSSFLVDIASILSSFYILDEFYHFFAFNLDMFSYVLSSLNKLEFIFLLVLSIVLLYMLEIYTHKTSTSIFFFLFLYSTISFILYFFYILGMLTIETSTFLLLSSPLIFSYFIIGLTVFELVLLVVLFIIAMINPLFSFMVPFFMLFLPLSFLTNELFYSVKVGTLEEELLVGVDRLSTVLLCGFVMGVMFFHLGESVRVLVVLFSFLASAFAVISTLSFFIKKN